jgi:Mce-associated membrane protein
VVAAAVTGAARALAVLAAGAAAWGGWSWYAAAHDSSAAYAQSRDQVLAAGEQAVQNLNTLDWQHVSTGLNTWDQSTTGGLRSQLDQGKADFTKQVEQARTVTTARVLAGAVTELDRQTGRASVMVALQITVATPGSAATTKQSRLLGQLTRTAQGWKLSDLAQASSTDQ